jgi:hypothetical protein
MTLRMAFVAGFATCLLVTWLLGKRKAQTAQPVSPTTEDAKWDKRIDELNSFYAEEKAHSRLGKRR